MIDAQFILLTVITLLLAACLGALLAICTHLKAINVRGVRARD